MGYFGVQKRICKGAVCKSEAAWAADDKAAAEKKAKDKKKKGTDTSMYRRPASGRYG